MSEWWGYRPEDFLLFAPRTYWRLFELENAALWPLPVVTLLIGSLILFGLVFRQRTGPSQLFDRAVAATMAGAWIWIGASFIGNRYAAINWVVEYVEPLFYAEGLLLAWLGAVRGWLHFAVGRCWRSLVGLALFAYALVLHPLTTLADGRPLAGAAVFGIAPDPTAIATLGLATTLPRGSAAPLLLAIPIGWSLATWATLVTMGAWQGWLLLGAAALALVARLRPPPARARRDG